MKQLKRKKNTFALRMQAFAVTSIFTLTLFMVSGCSDSRPVGADSADDHESAEVLMSRGQGAAHSQGMSANFAQSDADLVRAVTAATARYHSTQQAIRAGYEPDDHCVQHPFLGGMGYHWANEDLVDPVFNPLEPEAILYAPDKNGNLKMVGLEYIVINVGQDWPHFGDHPFDEDGVPPLMNEEPPVPHWSLHVWLWENNPAGMFEPFNPNISCPM